MTNHDLAWAVLLVASFALPKPWSSYAIGAAAGLSLASVLNDLQGTTTGTST